MKREKIIFVRIKQLHYGLIANVLININVFFFINEIKIKYFVETFLKIELRKINLPKKLTFRIE